MKCKRCELKTSLTEDDIQKAVDAVKNMKNIRLADENTYEKRLEICDTCDKLMYTSTCAACGCLVRVRALTADGTCPKKRW